MKKKTKLILEYGEHSVKLCHTSKIKDEQVIDLFEVRERKDFSDSLELSNFYHQFIQTPPAELIVSIDREVFLIRFLELPSQKREEIKEMLPFQLSKIIPNALEEVYFDFFIISSEQGYSKVVVFILQKRKVAILFDFLKKENLLPTIITMSSWGLYCWWDLNFNKQKEPLGEAVVLVDIDKEVAEFVVLKNERIIFSRAFSHLGEQGLNEGLIQSLHIFEKEYGRQAFAKAVVTSADKVDIVRKYFPDAEVTDANQQGEYSSASISGLSFNFLPLPFDISPDTIVIKRRQKKQKQLYLQVAVVVLEVALIFSIFLGQSLWKKHIYLNRLNQAIKEMTGEVKFLDKVVDKLEVLDKEQSLYAPFSKLLYQLIFAIPNHTQITFVDFRKDKDFSLKGYANDIARVFEIVAALNQSSLFSGVKVKYANQIEREEGVKIDFYIYGKIKK